MKALPYFFIFFIFIVNPISQGATENWIETEATILEVHKSVKAKGTYAYATVGYQDIKGAKYRTRVRLMAIPFIGSLKSVNDTMTIYYDPEKPMIAKSADSSFLESYGLYIFIAIGVLLSIGTIKKMMTSRNKNAA